MVPRIHHGMPNAAPRRQRSRKTARDHHHIVFANRHNVKCTLRSRSLNGMGSDDEGGARSGRLVYKIGPDVHPILGQVLDGRGWRSVSGDDDGSWTLNWQHNRFPKSSYMSCAPHQRLNHCQKSSGITKKDALARQLRRMRNTFGKVYDFSPETWILPRERDQLSARFSSNEIWIVKPCASSKGRDIFLATSAQLTESNDLSQMACIVQRYIPNPMLVFGYKCDLRLYVLVKSFQPLKAYLYRRGLARFTTQQYSLDVDTLGNPYCHLTNSSINRFSPSMSDDKGGIGPGCKWTLARFFSNLAERGFNVPRVQRRIRHLVALTLLSVAHEIVPNRNCFELFGFDVLLDCQAKPYYPQSLLACSAQTGSPVGG
ncbi:hypothetical protein PBRA_000478 [Plasmodiophora brassicae]|uniref:Tubulin--tyrosine ligase-like protein 9 n=1 Tax=Plasmodiophora brassicae TaxID=37360 RepID=A0A0G4IHJ9_PLABS|nr:hypothetical protein PBRA_000478 [Plasmodiophora brassicae]